MADNTTNLALPFIVAAQAQKHVTHNEALQALDAIVMLSVLDRDLAAPPGSPVDGARYLAGASPAGAWAGQAGKIAAWQDGAWAFYTAKEGWLCWIADEDLALVYDGAAWVSPGLQNARMVGVGTTADSTNKLAVAAASALFTHVGNGFQIKINKSNLSDTASVLFQNNCSGRAEFGLCGDDDFHVKLSADGSTWVDAMRVDRNAGHAAFAGAVKVASYAKASAPSASALGAGAVIYVSDAEGGAVLAFSDGSNWRSVTDRIVIA
jgi:hypothetical protein